MRYNIINKELIRIGYYKMNALDFIKLKKIEEELNNIDKEEQIVLFHSGTKDLEEELSCGVSGGFGDWLEEVLLGATDDEDLVNEIRENTCLSFYSEEPNWVTAKISKKLKKSVYEITEEDIVEHGQLCILIVDREDEDFRVAGSKEDDYVEKSTFFNGEIADYELPFGVEKGDIYSVARYNPVDYTLTGNELLTFLNKYYPEANIVNKNNKKNKNKIKV